MNILFIHHAFPGQFRHLAKALASDPANDVTFVTFSRRSTSLVGVRKVAISAKYPAADHAKTHPFLGFYEPLIQTGEVIYSVCRDLTRTQGLHPDIIVSHHGAGVGLFVRDAFPDTPILTYQEYFPPPDQDFQRTFPPEQCHPQSAKSNRIFVSHLLSQLVWTDWSLTPTFWQRSLLPAVFHPRISVLHDGIDTDAVDPSKISAQPLRLPDGAIINCDDELVTYVARNFDTVRGFPTAMRAIKVIQERRPKCHFILLGGDGIGYGNAPPQGKTWREFMLKETGLDTSQVHMLGQVDYSTYLRVLRLSKAHIYLTTGFVLSWSLLEAMSAECLVVCSDSPPVQEVVEHGFNGLLANFHDHERIADHVLEALSKPSQFQYLRREARRTIEKRYALKHILPLQQDLLRDLAAGCMPPKTAERIAERNALLGLDRIC